MIHHLRTCLLVTTFLCSCWAMPLRAANAPAAGNRDLQLTLPPELYAVPGVPMHVYNDNIVLTPELNSYRFAVTCDIGKQEPRCWTAMPKQDDIGTHLWRVTVTDGNGRACGQATMHLNVVPADAGAGQSVRLLVVGDSLTHATTYVNRLAELLSKPGNPAWTMLGTHRVSWAAKGVVHEGYGGWTWQRFVEHYEPKPDPKKRRHSSPFVFLNAAGQPKLDVKQYIERRCNGIPLDFAVFLLGINDCFSADPNKPAAIDARVDNMFRFADKLITAFRQAAPGVSIGICLTPAPNAREQAFDANYHGRYTRWGWKRIQHRLVQRQIEWVLAKQDGNTSGHRAKIFIIPTELNIDPVDGYPDNNGVHPNPHGYEQIGTTIYAWLKSRLVND